MKAPTPLQIVFLVLFGLFLAGALFTIIGAGLALCGVWSPEDAAKRLRTAGKYMRRIWLAAVGVVLPPKKWTRSCSVVFIG